MPSGRPGLAERPPRQHQIVLSERADLDGGEPAVLIVAHTNGDRADLHCASVNEDASVRSHGRVDGPGA